LPKHPNDVVRLNGGIPAVCAQSASLPTIVTAAPTCIVGLPTAALRTTGKPGELSVIRYCRPVTRIIIEVGFSHCCFRHVNYTFWVKVRTIQA